MLNCCLPMLGNYSGVETLGEPLILRIDTTLPGASVPYTITGGALQIDWGAPC